MIHIAILSKTHKDFNKFINSLPGYIKCTNIEFYNIINLYNINDVNIDYYIKLDTKPTNNKMILNYMKENNIKEITIKKLIDVF